MLQESNLVVLEVGPGHTLSSLAKQHPKKTANQVILTSLRHAKDSGSDVAYLLSTLGKLWLTGTQIDWFGFYTREQRQRISLPTYPFERQRYWIESQKETIYPQIHREEFLGKKLINSQIRKEEPLDKKSDIADFFTFHPGKKLHYMYPLRLPHSQLKSYAGYSFLMSVN